MKKTAVVLAFVWTALMLHPYMAVAEPAPQPLACDYRETRGINPKTKKPYTPHERHQEPFDGGSITKAEVKACLKAKKTIKNHHIVFEDYRDACQELGDYDIPLLIEGGVMHAKTPYDDASTPWYEDKTDDTGGIRLDVFRYLRSNDASDLSEDERRQCGIDNQEAPIIVIRAPIQWQGVRIDSSIWTSSAFTFSKRVGFSRTTFSGRSTNFRDTTFSGETDFSRTNFSGEITDFSHTNFSERSTDFSHTNFSGRSTDFSRSNFSRRSTDFNNANFSGEITDFSHTNFSGEITDFSRTNFSGESTNFNSTIFSGKTTDFNNANFSGRIYFIRSIFSGDTDFSSTIFSGITYFVHTIFSGDTDFSRTTFSISTDFSRATFSGRSTDFNRATFSGRSTDFSHAKFEANINFRNTRVTETLIFDSSSWEKRLDLRGMSAKRFRWDSTQNPSLVQGVVDMREAWIGLATFKEILFQNLVDFSRTKYGVSSFFGITGTSVERLPSGAVSRDVRDKLTDIVKQKFTGKDTLLDHLHKTIGEKLPDQYQSLILKQAVSWRWEPIKDAPTALRFENNTLEKEADLLHVTFQAPVHLINNRFCNHSRSHRCGVCLWRPIGAAMPLLQSDPASCL
ncbi:MAG: hypothetical protein ETSY2_26850 [Candidatus Entotheonella gemina]|uniref:Pentapeptide repeat-containing protein n=1 Tax=Candidatus Entotheonella gemina TaxID=1429439 RepID=W4M3Q3_9BACT|nr:MAG: hypothetical protein ETSY2_26850 [Candidatus Entotheonella gemina]